VESKESAERASSLKMVAPWHKRAVVSAGFIPLGMQMTELAFIVMYSAMPPSTVMPVRGSKTSQSQRRAKGKGREREAECEPWISRPVQQEKSLWMDRDERSATSDEGRRSERATHPERQGVHSLQ